jgi:SAM-dependent methyltransferase
VTRPGYDPALFELLAEVESRSFWFRSRNRLIVSVVRRHFPEARRMLEVGCGSGVVLAALRAALPDLRLVGCDLYPEGLAIARRRVPDVELLELEATALPFDAEFDVVGAFDVIEHVDEDERVLAEIYRSVRPGGGAVLLVPQHPWLWSAHDRLVEHRRRYSRRGLVRKVQNAGFELDLVTSFVSFLLPAMVGARAVRRVLRRPYDPVPDLQPGRLNGGFERVLDVERRMIEHGVSLPVGGSLLVVARKA